MNRDDIIRMAREAGLLGTGKSASKHINEVEEEITDDCVRFANLIEQHLSYDSIHTCHAECQRPACAATRRAVEAEREACAEMVAGMNVQHPKHIAAAIRARGEK